MIVTIVIFILTLLILVVIHELGHFLAAKKFGIKVEEFGFGIPPRAWGKKIGETLVSINWLPFGGFVKLLGEDEPGPLAIRRKGPETSRYFMDRSVGQRIVVVVMGVLMNLLLAWILLYVVLSAQKFEVKFPLLLDHRFSFVTQKNAANIFVQSVSPSSPAEVAGFKPGDKIVAVNNEFISKSQDLTEKTKLLAGKEIKIVVENEVNNLKTVQITPRKNPPQGEGPLGIGLIQVQVATIKYDSLLSRVFAGPIHSWNLIAYSGKILGNLVQQSFERKDLGPVSHSIAGPVGVTQVINQVLSESHSPVIDYLNLVALLSLNLAVLNILPFPALDGGRLFFLLVEAVTRKRVHANVEKWIHQIGFVLLLALMLLVTFSDIRKLLP